MNVKKLMCIILCLIMLPGAANVYGEEKVYVYAPDGRKCVIYQKDVEAWKKVGWYTYPVITVYATDGRNCIINRDALTSWEKVGWYSYPVTQVYSPSGESAVINRDATQQWIQSGWYLYPVATVYAPDGRVAVIAKSDVPAWVSVGWTDKNTRDRSVYLGEWVNTKYDGNRITVYKCENGKISFLITSVNGRGTRIATALLKNVKMQGDSGRFYYSDSFGWSGLGTITFGNGKMSINYDEPAVQGVGWSVITGEGEYVKKGNVSESFNPDIYG